MRVYLDTVAVIYLVENVTPWGSSVKDYLAQPGVVPQASVLTRMECRVQPLREKRAEQLADYEIFSGSLSGGLLELTPAAFEKAAELRADMNFKTPDALHLAAAISSGCDVFLTNDRGLARCADIQIAMLDA